MSDVFISHDTSDQDLVLQLARQLEAAGISTWYYERDAVPGVAHTSQTGNAIAAAKATLLVLSSNSIRSYEVNTEVNWTYSEHKSFVPVLVGITWAQFAREKKAWQQLIGLSAGIEATPDNLPMVVSKIAKGLSQLERAAATATDPPATPSGIPGFGSLQAPPTVAAQAQPERKHNLPLQVTTFFGRETEIEQLKARLAKHRLVTLTGPGGVGKTRLSLRTAEEVLDDFSDGVWLVELALLSDPALVTQQVASILGLRDDSQRPILETLTAFLRDRQLLLVLDNCEHQLEACGRLADSLLRACPRVRILDTSREPLGIAGEAVFSVPSLNFPNPEHLPPIDQMTDYMAVNLFIDRARLVLPDYQLTAGNAAALTRICQRLDGIPLAIEMAAARLNILKAEHLADRLDDAFRLLTGGSRSALPRQQTLRATVDWSYKLLSEPERLLFHRLSVFAGGCTLEAAEAVCAGEGLEAADVLDLLASLVAKSMVIADRQPDVELRYHLLEIVRQYAREKLHDSGDTARLRTRHRDYFLTIAEAVARHDGTPAYSFWSGKLAVDLDNVRLALQWSFDDQTALEAAPRLVYGALFIWPSPTEMAAWAKRAVEWCQNHPQIPARLHASLLSWTSLTQPVSEWQTASDWLKRAADISRGLGPDQADILITSLVHLTDLSLEFDTVESALESLNEAETVLLEHEVDSREPGLYRYMLADSFRLKATIAIKQGRYQEAKRHADEGIRRFQDDGKWWEAGQTLIQRAIASQYLGEYDRAHDDLLQARHTESYGFVLKSHEAHIRHRLGRVEYHRGNLDRAFEYCWESLRLANEIHDYFMVALNLALAADVAARRGQPSRAARLSGAAQTLFAQQHREPSEDFSLATLLPGWRERPDRGEISTAFDAGKGLNAEQAATYALSDAAV